MPPLRDLDLEIVLLAGEYRGVMRFVIGLLFTRRYKTLARVFVDLDDWICSTGCI